MKQFVEIPYIYAKDIQTEEDKISAVQKVSGIKNFKILIEKIKPGTIIKIGCGYFKIAGNTGDRIILHNFNQLFLPTEMAIYVKMVSKIFSKIENKLPLEFEGENILFSQNRFGEKTLLTKEKNLELYKELVKHLNKAIYREVSINAIAKRLKLTYEKFSSLDCQRQVQTLGGLLNIINGTNGGNLENVGEKKTCGVLTTSKKLSNKPISLIYYSPTGYYKKELKLS